MKRVWRFGLQGVDGDLAVLLWFPCSHNNRVHRFEGLRGKINLATLVAYFNWHVPKDVKVILPPMDVLYMLAFDGTLAEVTIFHSRLDPPPPMIPLGIIRSIERDEDNGVGVG